MSLPRTTPQPSNAGNADSSSRDLKNVLRERQQGRSLRSCLPCRERKVKCDHQLPCGTCSKRGHPDLCSYLGSGTRRLRLGADAHGSPRRARLHQSAQSETQSNDGVPSFLNNDPHLDPAPRIAASSSERERNSILNQNVTNNAEPTLLGDISIVPTALGLSSSPAGDFERRNAYEKGILPLLGLEDDEGVPTALPHFDNEVLYNSLPSDQDMVSLFETHRLRCNPFHIITYDIEEVQSKLCNLINTRKKAGATMGAQLQGDLRWVCLLHAILAAGAQSSDLPLERRLSLSQSHTTRAFESLRASNYLASPFKEALQTLLLLSYVLQNDMKPQAAWVLQGSTIRLALCLGLHKQAHQTRNSPIPSDEARLLRLAIVWQDTLLSLAFDRPPASYDFDFDEDLPSLRSDAISGTVTYRQGMSWISHLGLRYLPRQHRRSPALSARSATVWQDLELIEANVLPHLKDAQLCSTIQEIQEYYSFRLHRNFFAATVCRHLVSPNGAMELGSDDQLSIVSKVQDALRHGAQAYLDLRSLSTYARHSWAFIHNGLASVLLLSLLPDTRCTAETKRLQDDFINGLKASTSSDCDLMPISYLSVTLRKALKALVSLQKLADQETNASLRVHNTVPLGGTIQPFEQSCDPGTVNERHIEVDGDNTKEIDAWAMGGWDIPLDFDISPLQTFDYIMSDPYGIGDNM
ncbi:hypothetical protein BKA67DRAFT_576609 [Truncatella angustata]|uniref:Zn(2)-C6 fungal-type domain-containing protein n=1 Tax=Truncatella angustata TaxID=152316 RepID=A0A9P8UFI6_9PEZI|nr:uncharacterized protein BKA67DRAFT_576609 [Truncatella angustata]KAH6649036.1 hypothetical protein BKA67DRAFT_576609 [Truncatella angustata]